MTDQESFEAWWQNNPDRGPSRQQSEAWHAALAYLRSQQEPVAFDVWASDEPYHVFRTESSARNYAEGLSENHGEVRVVPLYAAPQPAIPDGWREAIESISEFGDDTLCDEAFHAIRADKDAAEQALRIAVRLTKEEAIEKLEALAAAPEPHK